MIGILMSRSGLEASLVNQIQKAGLDDGLVLEFRFHPERRWRFDLAWPELKLACEVHGGVFTRGRHSRPKGMLNDMEKTSEACIMGWRVVLVSSLEVRNGQALDRVRRLLESSQSEAEGIEPPASEESV